MDKAPIVVEPRNDSIKAGRILAILASAVVVLAVAFVILIAAGTWYVSSVQDCATEVKTKKPQTEYDISVKVNNTIVNEHITVNEDEKTELFIGRAPETKHISHLLASDYSSGVYAVYDAESHTCYLAEQDGEYNNFEQSVEILKETNGQVLDEPMKVNYTRSDREVLADDIPQIMTSFCSVANTHWVRKLMPGEIPRELAEQESEHGRDKRTAPCHLWVCYRCFLSCCPWQYQCGWRWCYGCH